MFNLDINKVPFNTAANIGFSVLGGMLAPFFYLFQFAKPIFDKYDLLTLLVLSLAIGGPMIIFFLMLNSSARLHNTNITLGDIEATSSTIFLKYLRSASIDAAMVLYLPCIMSYFASTTLRNAIFYSLAATFGIFIRLFFSYKKQLENESKSEAKKRIDAT